VGTLLELAPPYDPSAEGLVSEESIGALEKSKGHVWREMKESEEERRREVVRVVTEGGTEVEKVQYDQEEEDEGKAMEMPAVVHVGSHDLRSLPGEGAAQGVSTALHPGSHAESSVSLGSLDAVGGSYDSRSQAVESLTSDVFGSRLPVRSASYTSLTSTVVSDGIYDQQLSHGEASNMAIPGLSHMATRASSHLSLASLALHNRVVSATRFDEFQEGSTHAPSMTTFAPLYGTTYTPHDRALFLADSAPGSRLASVSNTPIPSRPVSPTNHALTHGLRYSLGHSLRNDSTLRAIASTSRLSALLAEEDVRRATSPLSEVIEGTTSPSPHVTTSFEPDTNVLPEDWLDPVELNAYIQSISRPSSRLGSPFSPPQSRNKPIGTGRPRRASMALNEAYNAAHPPSAGGVEKSEGSSGVVGARIPKCPIHGEECDGVTVTETWRTQHAKNTSGFRDLYPVIFGAGERQMVDWYGLLKDEQQQTRSGSLGLGG
jgi:hypothetical protein